MKTGLSYDQKLACSDNTRQKFRTQQGNPVKLDWTRKV